MKSDLLIKLTLRVSFSQKAGIFQIAAKEYDCNRGGWVPGVKYDLYFGCNDLGWSAVSLQAGIKGVTRELGV